MTQLKHRAPSVGTVLATGSATVPLRGAWVAAMRQYRLFRTGNEALPGAWRLHWAVAARI